MQGSELHLQAYKIDDAFLLLSPHDYILVDITLIGDKQWYACKSTFGKQV